ncbi:MAG: hydantoinase B/oxoprolinase family protein [Shimia sp.]
MTGGVGLVNQGTWARRACVGTGGQRSGERQPWLRWIDPRTSWDVRGRRTIRAAHPYPAPGAAVIAGNTEVSQAVAEVLMGALGAMAGSQGTMNNFVWGTEAFQNYETIAGGAGAGPGWHGASAVQTHMTNTRMTDPEVLEARFPVRVARMAIRRGSGGAGRWRGGCGLDRALTALAPMEVTVLSSNRRTRPHGLDGGGPGAPGENLVRRACGREEPLEGNDRTALAPGDTFVMRTPGGGGCGEG